MKYALLCILIAMGLPHCLFAQNPYRDRIITQAKLVARATEKNDYQTLATLCYPKLLEQKGGHEKMAVELKEKSKQLTRMGIELIDMKIGEPDSVYLAGTELHCLVPESLQFKTPAGTLSQKSWLLAVSSSNGLNWYFIDLSLLNEKKIKELFPAFNPLLKIPAANKAELTRED